MSQPGSAYLDPSTYDEQLVVTGDWTLPYIQSLEARVIELKRQISGQICIDAKKLGRLDTAGASLLLELINYTDIDKRITGIDSNRQALIAIVAATKAEATAPPIARTSGLLLMLGHMGVALETLWHNLIYLVGFIGVILATFAHTLLRPRRWRVTSLVFHIEQTGLNAVPIVILLSFLIGAVIAFLGATVLKDFGASVFTVELVGYSVLREFGVLLTAILIAGRSGSAFTAQIGSMKAREEIDAIRTLGLDPIEVLVLPRILALLIALPLLTLLAMFAGIIGGGAVCIFSLDVSPGMFLTRFYEATEIRHFWVGMSKAPLFAFLIAAIGCLEGFKVSGSAESVGDHTTSSVVQSIFAVIMLDALAAIFFMELNW